MILVNEKTMLSMQVSMGEKAAFLQGASNENRSLSNYLLVSALEHTKAIHGITPKYEEDDLEKGE